MVKGKKEVKSRKRQKPDYRLISTISVILVLLLAVFISKPDFIKSSYLAAEVNGEQIKISDVNGQYDVLPEDYKLQITKDMILNAEIEMTLLKQEAEAQGLVLTDDQFEELLNQALQQAGMTEEELESQLKEQGKTIEDIKTQFIIKTMLDKILIDLDETEQQQVIQSYVDGLREKADIKIYME